MTTSADQCRLTSYKQAGSLDAAAPVFPDAIAWQGLRIDSEGIALNPNYATVSELTASRGTTDSHRTGANVGGEMQGKLAYDAPHQDLLASLFGAAWATDELVPGLVRDLWAFQKHILQEDGVTTDYHRFYNATVGAWSLSIPAEGELEQTIEVVGGHMDPAFIASPALPTYPAQSSTPTIAQEDVTITWAGGLGTPLAGFCISALSLEVNGGNRQKQCIGELGGEGLLGRLAVSGEATVYYANATAAAAFLDQDVGTLAISMVDTAASPNTLLIEMDKVKLTGAPVPIQGTGTDMVYQITFEAHEVAGGDQIKVTRTPGP